jgi:hypothetical protein
MAWFLTIGTSESQNPGGNTSTVSAALYLNWNNAERYSGTSTSGHINIGGNIFPFTGPTSGGSTAQTGSTLLYSYPLTYTHDANGYRGPVGTGGFFDSAPNPFAPQNLSVSGPTYGAIDYVRLPSAPSSVSAVATGPTVVVTSGEASTPGPTITNYWVSFASSSNGGATFGSWSSESAMTSRAFTYTLTPGLTYKFRVRAQNTDGYGGFTESASLFLAAGGKRWTGADWALTVNAAKRFNGTAWVDLTTAKRYTDAGTWVNLS